MRLEAKKYIHDIGQAIARIDAFTGGKNFQNYAEDAMLRAAVERQFEIIGEALSKLATFDTVIVERISEYRRIIAFRNILIHGYTEVDDRLVWDVVESKLPTLRDEIHRLQGEG